MPVPITESKRQRLPYRSDDNDSSESRLRNKISLHSAIVALRGVEGALFPVRFEVVSKIANGRT
jgi:hypothetical protein